MCTIGVCLLQKGCTPLHSASARGSEEAVKALIEARAEVNATDQVLHDDDDHLIEPFAICPLCRPLSDFHVTVFRLTPFTCDGLLPRCRLGLEHGTPQGSVNKGTE
jgi:hypothetical protein